ncbi:DUF2631 domain-containing protein [Geodermatophilus sp. YIM 151500]|uniref:DUF2631 domain-containing protein n=1 Tax=Geodermatophilus sp. YIM 151500 TaxID=2984531 RepID=UPI0021E395C4|nr:DUF2631 domain-containing protein [Geodermatophilus sp. YIM 151500]MCV2488982.1 DUF2631 domain-containing protein [Geodermatophilus sp. YIM 151500]
MSEQIRNRRDAQAAGTHAVAQPHREEGYVSEGDHPVEHERPEDWGWHGETGAWGRRGAWLVVLLILAFLIGNHEGRVEDLWILGTAALLAAVLVWDVFRRKNAWRSR